MIRVTKLDFISSHTDLRFHTTREHFISVVYSDFKNINCTQCGQVISLSYSDFKYLRCIKNLRCIYCNNEDCI